jgi:lipopolysaccharide transport system ATP-binding protein
MSDVVIRVENLGKRYRIGERERYVALRDVLARAISTPVRLFKARKPASPNGDPAHIWALKDVSFEVRQGEMLGIIGRNGAGKTTLLKILARVTRPTEGHAWLKGRVGSLLEVGTGFHTELTGRENVYLSGAILGMGKKEIDRKFDEIVAFAEVEKFIDTPLKHYSTGMQMRLAFAVAAHLEPEMLLVDEVLAVGDAEFQRKCLAKMQQVAVGGRTILFVSHNMAAIRQICRSGVVLDRGGVVKEGEINDAVDTYLARVQADQSPHTSVETPTFVIETVQIASTDGRVLQTFDTVEIRVRLRAKCTVRDPGLYVSVLTLDNERITALDLKDFITAPAIQAGETTDLGFRIKDFPVLPGSYHLEIYVKDMVHSKIELVPRTYPFDVVETPVYGGRKIDRWYGKVALRARGFSELAADRIARIAESL